MIATRLSSVWQVAGVAAAALCCYLVSQSVASERGALAKVDRQITAEQDAITKLSTEIATRSRLTQVESWNRQLALQAPRPGQYMASGFQLASLYAHDAKPQLPLDPAIASPRGPIEQVAFRAPAPAAPPPAAALPAPTVALAPTRAPIEQAAFHPARPKPARAPAADLPDAAPPAQPLLRTATFLRPKPSRLADDAGGVEAAAFRPASLLSADIASLARAEQAKRTARPAKGAR